MRAKLLLMLLAFGLLCSLATAQDRSTAATPLNAAGAVFAQETQSNEPQLNNHGQTQGDYVIKNFRFRSGGGLPEMRLPYVPLGKPHRNSSGEIDNAVLLLHSTGSDTT